MDKNKILIIGLIAVIIALLVAIVVSIQTNEEIEYENLTISDTCTLSVPVCNNSTFTNDDGIKSYNGTNVSIVSYNKNDFGTWENMGAEIGINSGVNQNFKYNHTHNGNNILLHPEDNKTLYGCLISNNTTGDVIFIVTNSEEILYHIIDNINFTSNNNNSDTADEVIKATSDNTNDVVDTANEEPTDEPEYTEGYIAENDQDFDYDGDGVGDGSAYHSHEYYVEHGQTEPVKPNSG